MTELPHRLDRTIVINARPETVFRFLTDSAKFASWWGAGSAIDPRVGGEVYIKHPGNVEARGAVVEIDAPTRLVFTYGFVSGTPMGPGASLVTITLKAQPSGTRLTLQHEFADVAARDHHVQGWRYQLSLFANVVCDDVCAGVADNVDRWFACWSEPDADVRQRTLVDIAADTVQFRDRYSHTDGLADLLPHIAATQHFMPGIRLLRQGAVRHCQGTVLADWSATKPDGTTVMKGVNVFRMDAGGAIESVTGILDSGH